MHLGGVAVRNVRAGSTPEPLRNVLENVEAAILSAADGALPGWNPTKQKLGTRVVAMADGSVFGQHTDNYQGLVAAVQLGIEGEKTMTTCGQDIPIKNGDVILFACDNFGKATRVPHGFEFSGMYAVSFTLGQDPFYKISS